MLLLRMLARVLLRLLLLHQLEVLLQVEMVLVRAVREVDSRCLAVSSVS